MSITDELREWAKGSTLSSWTAEHLTAIADRIDAEHESVCYDYQREFEDWKFVHDTEFVELPKDVDGEPIHVCDVMEWVRYEDDDPTIVREVSAVGDGVFFAWSSEQGRFAQYEAHAYRHHHAPTVEDVLRGVVELCHNTWKEGSAFEPYDVDDVMMSGNIADFAAKLRLRGDAE